MASAHAQVWSAHDAEMQIEEQLVHGLGALYRKHGYMPPDEIRKLQGEIYRSFDQIIPATGAKFTYVPRGAVADQKLGPAWMDQRGFIRFDPLFFKENGELVNIEYDNAKKACGDLRTSLGEKKRFKELMKDLGNQPKSGFEPPSFFSALKSGHFWMSDSIVDYREIEQGYFSSGYDGIRIFSFFQGSFPGFGFGFGFGFRFSSATQYIQKLHSHVLCSCMLRFKEPVKKSEGILTDILLWISKIEWADWTSDTQRSEPPFFCE
jgi:hypothetical protein